jgi:hypothetical protein
MISKIVSKNTSDVEHVKQLVLSTFQGRDLADTHFFLQMSVACDRSRRLLVLRQQRHVDQLVQASGSRTACLKSLPVITGIHIDSIVEEITDCLTV